MAKRKWIRTESQYADDGIMVCVEPDGLISVRLSRRRKSYSVPAGTLYEALRARDALGLGGTTVPVFSLEPGRAYKELGTNRQVYTFRHADIRSGTRRFHDGSGCHWWVISPGDNWQSLGEGNVDSKEAADAVIAERLAWLKEHCRFVEDRPPGDEDAGDAGDELDRVPRA